MTHNPILPFGALALWVFGCGMIPGAHAAAAEAEGAKTPAFFFGACTHFAQNKGDAAPNLDLAAQAGLVSLRDEITWSAVERGKGQLDFPPFFDAYLDAARARGIAPLVLLNYANKFYDGGGYPASPEAVEGYVRYGEAVIARAGDRAKLFQVWNEWDGGCGMKGFGRGKAEGYVRLLKAAYPRFKRLAPDATFISNSVCTGEAFLEETFKLGLLDHCDAVGFHTYNYNGADNTAEAWLERMRRLRALIHRYNDNEDKPVYVTEMGWPNQVNATGSTEYESAVKLARLYLYARTLPFVKGVWWYDFQDDGWNATHHENNFGLVRADLTPKLPFFAAKTLARRLSHSALLESRPLEGGLLLRFTGPDGPFWAVVNSAADRDLQLVLERDGDGEAAPLTLEVVGSEPVTRPWGYRDWPRREAAANPRRLAVTAGEMPLLLSGGLEAVRVASVSARPFPRADRPQRSRLRLPRGYAEIVRTGQREIPAEFRHYHKLAAAESGGSDDLSARFSGRYDRDRLYLSVTVTDDVFHQPETVPANAWLGDGLQLAFQVPDGDDAAARTELDAALLADKAEVFVRATQGDGGGKPECVIERRGKETVYRLTVPARLLGLKAFEPGAMLAAAILVNDNDGDGRKGFLAWGGGIGIAKDPSQYYLFLFK